MEPIADLFKFLNGVSPLAVIALLAWIVYLLVSEKGPMRKLTDNHLHGLPSMEKALDELVKQSRAQTAHLSRIEAGIEYLKGRINGRS